MGLTNRIHCLLPHHCRQGATWVCCLVAVLQRCLVASYCLSKWLLMIIFVKTEVRQGGVNDKEVRYSCLTCYFPLCHFRLKVRLRTQPMQPWVADTVKRKIEDHLKEGPIIHRYCDMTVLKLIAYFSRLNSGSFSEETSCSRRFDDRSRRQLRGDRAAHGGGHYEPNRGIHEHERD